MEGTPISTKASRALQQIVNHLSETAGYPEYLITGGGDYQEVKQLLLDQDPEAFALAIDVEQSWVKCYYPGNLDANPEAKGGLMHDVWFVPQQYPEARLYRFNGQSIATYEMGHTGPFFNWIYTVLLPLQGE